MLKNNAAGGKWVLLALVLAGALSVSNGDQLAQAGNSRSEGMSEHFSEPTTPLILCELTTSIDHYNFAEFFGFDPVLKYELVEGSMEFIFLPTADTSLLLNLNFKGHPKPPTIGGPSTGVITFSLEPSTVASVILNKNSDGEISFRLAISQENLPSLSPALVPVQMTFRISDGFDIVGVISGVIPKELPVLGGTLMIIPLICHSIVPIVLRAAPPVATPRFRLIRLGAGVPPAVLPPPIIQVLIPGPFICVAGAVPQPPGAVLPPGALAAANVRVNTAIWGGPVPVPPAPPNSFTGEARCDPLGLPAAGPAVAGPASAVDPGGGPTGFSPTAWGFQGGGVPGCVPSALGIVMAPPPARQSMWVLVCQFY